MSEWEHVEAKVEPKRKHASHAIQVPETSGAPFYTFLSVLLLFFGVFNCLWTENEKEDIFKKIEDEHTSEEPKRGKKRISVRLASVDYDK